jgi:hypothetical protein
VFQLFPQPAVPARGNVAFQFDFIVLVAAAVAMMILSFYVVDAIQLNSNFIRMFAREVTKWGRAVTERSHLSPPLNDEELSAYHEIFFIAQRTQAIARLIWYPLIVLTLMIVARSSFFDHWTWPASLILIYALNAMWGDWERDVAPARCRAIARGRHQQPAVTARHEPPLGREAPNL